MENFDARKLKSDAQELLRQQAVRAVIEGGMTKTRAAEFFGVSRYSIHFQTKPSKNTSQLTQDINLR